jgi:hypothetical protein
MNYFITCPSLVNVNNNENCNVPYSFLITTCGDLVVNTWVQLYDMMYHTIDHSLIQK